MTGTDLLPRGARRKAATRQRLLAAAAEVFAEVGVDGATIAAMTERADVGLGTFYLHFDDKDAIAHAVGEHLLAQVAAAAAEAALSAAAAEGGDPLDPLRAGIRAVCQVSASQAHVLAALCRWHGPAHGSHPVRDAFLDRIAGGLQTGMATGALRAEDSRLAAHAVMGLCTESVVYWAASGRDDWDVLAAFLERATIGALAAEPLALAPETGAIAPADSGANG